MSGFRSRRTVWQQLDFGARLIFPALTTFLLLILANLPLGLFAGGIAGSALLVPSVVFWTIFRPQTMPPPVVLLLGVLADLLSSSLLGVNGLVLLIISVLVRRWRKVVAQQPFLLVWCCVLLLTLLHAGLQWCLLSFLTLHSLPALSMLPQIVMTAVLYPALSLLLTRLHHLIGEAG